MIDPDQFRDEPDELYQPERGLVAAIICAVIVGALLVACLNLWTLPAPVKQPDCVPSTPQPSARWM